MRPRLRRPTLRRPTPGPWLPNGFTLANLGFGVYAILSASHGHFDTAVRCIVFGGVCDLFDGAVARATRTGSELGEQLDSLVDAISFGLAPAAIVYFLLLQNERFGWAPVFFYVASAVFRLARFNVTQAGAKKTHFIGLPSPASGGTLATYYWFTQTPLYQETRIVDFPWEEIMVALMLLLAAMMSSQVPYPAWPKIGLRTWRAAAGLLLVIGIVSASILFTKYFFFLFGVGYVGYGLLRALVLGFVDIPQTDTPLRRSTDYVDPIESYGMTDDDGEAERDALGTEMADGDDVRYSGQSRRRRRRRGRNRPDGTFE